jgi:hypothetical protein
MLLEALLIFSCLVAGFGFGCIYCGGRKTKVATPSASHNKASTQSTIGIQHAYFAGHRDGINQVIINYGWKAYRQRTC